jgi:peptidoglycan/LPS O-acetylase OafA/YrhL
MLRLKAPRSLGNAIESHDNGFNLVRLCCALLVVVYHAWQLARSGAGADPVSAILAPHADLGSIAVSVFFLVSGIFVTQSWMRDPHVGRYAARRLVRILPGLFACLLLTTLAAVAFFSDTGIAGMLRGEPWRFIFGSTILHGLQYIIPAEELRIPGVLGGIDLNGPLWTLYWEARMYVMVALLGVCAMLPQRTWLRAAAIFLLLAANLFPTVLSGYIWEVRWWSFFLAGMILQTLAPTVRAGLVHVLGALVLIALNSTRFQAMTGSSLTFFGLALLLGAIALWAGTARGPQLAHIRRHDYSYGIYIYHWPVILMVREVLPPVAPPLLLAATLAVLVPLAMLSWHFVERPTIDFARRWLKKKPY